MFKALALSLAFFFWGQGVSSTVDTSTDPIVIHYSPGGRVDEFAADLMAIAASGKHVVVDGPCYSACTMVLGTIPSDHLCATDRASFGFHMAYVRNPDGSVTPSATGTLWMAHYWPPYVKQWLKAHGGLTLQIKAMGAPDMWHVVHRCG